MLYRILILGFPLIIMSLFFRPAFAVMDEAILVKARQGEANAQYHCGLAHYLGNRGANKDHPIAAHWFQKAAEQDHTEAQFCLAVMLDKGEGGKQSTPLAIQWYQKAAIKGHAKAQFNLGQILYEGFNVPRDMNAGVLWFEKASNQGYARAQYHLGLAFLEGKGIVKNEKRAIELFEKAARQGDKDAAQLLTLLR